VDTTLTKRQKERVRKFRATLKQVIEPSNSIVIQDRAGSKLNSFSAEPGISIEILNEFKRFATLDDHQARERTLLQAILFCVASDDCVFQVIDPRQFFEMDEILTMFSSSNITSRRKKVKWDEKSPLLRRTGMGPEFVDLISLQMITDGEACATTLALFRHLREFDT
jgi:hypothetical protein